MNELLIAAPEIALLSMACIILIVDLYLPAAFRSVTYALTQLAFIGTAVLCWFYPMDNITIGFANHFIADNLAQTLKIVILVVMSFVMLYSRAYIEVRKIAFGEYHLLAMFATIGMMLLVSSNSLLMVYLGLELLSLPLYALVALNRHSSSSVEAAMKYFIMGSLASGMLLYGLSILYGVTGGVFIPEIADTIAMAHDTQGLVVFSMVFIIVGIAFKLGAVPFHMWVPDVYEGAPTSVTMLIGTAPKLAAFGMAFRLLAGVFPMMAQEWGHFLIVLALLSLAIGNITAIAQTNLKRMLAYSTIAHVGFVVLGLLAGGQSNFSAAMFYTVIYAILALGAFASIIMLSHSGFEAEKISDFKGLAKRNPWLAFLMLLILFSLAGVPPTIGFYAKLMVLNALVEANLTWLAIVAVAFTIIGAFYYLRVVKTMYFDEPVETSPIIGPLDVRVALSINGLAVLLLGLFPGPIIALCVQAF